jgi:hypothetical protein
MPCLVRSKENRNDEPGRIRSVSKMSKEAERLRELLRRT